MAIKRVEFIGTSLDDLKAFPDDARKMAGFELFALQQGIDPSDWKPMSSIGQGVREIRIRAKGAYRVIYLAKEGNTLYVLHAFQKKAQKTPKPDIELARQRYKAVLQRLRGGKAQ